MLAILLKTLPFFAVIGLGYVAARVRFFSEEATAHLTKFVFYFALTAMIFNFTANLKLSEVWDPMLVMGYLWGTACVYGIASFVAFMRGLDAAEAAIEGQCAAIGNVGFLGIPMLALLMGDAAVSVIVITLTIDLVVFSSLLVILISVAREGRLHLGIFRAVGLGLVRNPMIVAVVTGFTVSSLNVTIPAPVNDFLILLGAAATPGALFAIGASLATKSAERLIVAGWLTFGKLILHPLFVGLSLIFLFPVDPYTASVTIAAAALPVAGNIYILAQHYGVAPQRVSASILISTAISIVTVTAVISMVQV